MEPQEDNSKLRIRLDGVLQDVILFEQSTYHGLISRLKLLSRLKLNITDKPQDGRFTIEIADSLIEIRTSSLPAEYGESIVMRILNPKNLIGIDGLGLRKDLYKIFEKEIKKPNGMIIVTGPTGSGKTTTIIGKVKYIIDRYQVKPEDIILITFTDKAAKSIMERININGIEAKTFHSFGLNIIKSVEQKIPGIFNTDNIDKLLMDILENLSKNESFKNNFSLFLTEYLTETKSIIDFNSFEEYMEYTDNRNLETYNSKVTYKREVVKSAEECAIANFLFLNNIIYEYEASYEIEINSLDYRPYKPDFLIKGPNNSKIYLEHLGINKNGKIPDFFAKDKNDPQSIAEAQKKYTEKIDWARKIHSKFKTKLIETYSWENQEGKLKENLIEKLKSCGIECKPKRPNEIIEYFEKYIKNDYRDFKELLKNFLLLYKSNIQSIDEIHKNLKHLSPFHKMRFNIFISLFKPIYEQYVSFLNSRKEIDFSDMINKAADYIRTNQYSKRFKYVIVDEFQDTSKTTYNILKSIKEVMPDCKFFCVGDDWQSIYRFAGSDLALFTRFEEYFGYTEISKIETTYRYAEPLIKLSNNFIIKNHNQKKKNIKSNNPDKKTDYEIIKTDYEDDSKSILNIIDSLIQQNPNIQEDQINILTRFTFNLNDQIKIMSNNYAIIKESKNYFFSYKNLKIKIFSIHKSKGLEADYIILLNCNSGYFGFPAERNDDSLISLLLSETENFPFAEERRLFYVALTRAKSKIFIISRNGQESRFIHEIQKNLSSKEILKQEDQEKCPICKIGRIKKINRINKDGSTWSRKFCSNEKYKCTYQDPNIKPRNYCPICLKGNLIENPTVFLDCQGKWVPTRSMHYEILEEGTISRNLLADFFRNLLYII